MTARSAVSRRAAIGIAGEAAFVVATTALPLLAAAGPDDELRRRVADVIHGMRNLTYEEGGRVTVGGYRWGCELAGRLEAAMEAPPVASS